MIGRQLGHSEVQTTGHYAHLAGDCVKKSPVDISDSIAAGMLSRYAGARKESMLAAGAGGTENESVGFRPPFSCARIGGSARAEARPIGTGSEALLRYSNPRGSSQTRTAWFGQR